MFMVKNCRNSVRAAATVILLLLTFSVWAATVVPPRDRRIFPFDGFALKMLRGNTAPKIRLQPVGDILPGPVLIMELPHVAHETEFWLQVDVPFDASCRRLAWWINSRGASWAEVMAAVEEPDGTVRRYRVPSCGDSPWTRYEWEVQGPSSSVGTPEQSGRRSGERRFRGWIMRCPSFAGGKFIFGKMMLDHQPAEPALRYAWTFRDIDEQLMHQMAFSGFRLSFQGTGAEARLPLQLWRNGVADNAALEYLIYTSSGTIVDQGRIEAATSDAEKASDLILPALPVGNYWVTVRQLDAADNLLGVLHASYLVNHSPVKQLPSPRRCSMFNFWPGQAAVELKLSGLKDEAVKVPVRGLAAGDEVTAIWYGPDRRKAGETAQTVSGPCRELTFRPPVRLTGPAVWHLALQLKRQGKCRDQRTALLLIAGETPLPPTGSAVVEHSIFPLEETETISVGQEGLKESFGRHLAGSGNVWGMTFNWDEIEPVPGLIQYPLIDRYLAVAAAGKTPVTLTLYVHLDRIPRHLWYEQMQDQNGLNRHYSGSFTRRISPCGEKTWSALRRTIRQLVTHYNRYPGITGWNFSQGVESFWSDASRNHRVVGYSQASATAFRSWLQRRGRTLDQVGRDYGREFKNWDEVTPPLPVFDDKLDLRPIWLAWEEFKQQVPGELFSSLFQTVREIDSQRVLMQYSGMGIGDLNLVLPVYKKYRAQVCFGGGEALVHAYLQSLCRQAGVPLVGESSAVPPCPPAQLYSMFFELAYGDLTGGINIMWGRFFDTAAPAGTFLDASAQATKVAATVQRLGSTRLVTANAAIGTGMKSIINRSRSFMWVDWCNLNTFQFMDALVTTIGPCLQTGFVTENTPLEVLRNWPIIVFTEAPLLDDDAAARLVAYVREGGTLVLMGQTGLYDQNGHAADRLKTLLGNGPGDGKPVKFGKGRVLWLSRPLNWSKELLPLLAGLGYSRPVRVTDSRIRCALRRQADAEEYYLILFGKTWSGGNPRSGELGTVPVETGVVVNLPGPSRRWELENMVNGQSPIILSSRELSAGFKVKIKPAELQIIRIRAVSDQR